MEECFFPAKLKRKDLDEVNDDFCDFSLSSPARKIRRLDAELPPIIEEEEMLTPSTFGHPETSQDSFVEEVVRVSPIEIDEMSGSLPQNEERAMVLYDPLNNLPPSLQSRSPFSISVNSDFLTNPVLWWKRSNAFKQLEEKTREKEDDNGRQLAVVPWVAMHSQQEAMVQVSEMMDAADDMDIEDNDTKPLVPGKVSVGDGVKQWQQHYMVPQVTHNLSPTIAWSGTGS